MSDNSMVDDPNLNEKVVLGDVENQINYTLDCTDPTQDIDANCIVIQKGEETQISTNGG